MCDDARVTTSRAYVTLALAVLFVSTAGPFLEAARMDAFAVVFWRLVATAALMLGYARLRGAITATRAQLREIALGSSLLTLHFLLWIKAFDLTDYASNLLLLVAQPVIATVAGRWLGEPSSGRHWLAVGLSGAGLAIITGGDLALGPRALLGDLLCVLAGVAITGFYVVTRRTRVELPMPAFLGLTSAFGAAMTVPVLLVNGSRMLDYPRESWGWLAALVLVTTCAGHGLYNVAARHLSLFTLNIVIVVEPVIGIWMGAWMFGTQVTTLQVAGGAVLASAVLVGLWPAGKTGPAPAV